MVVANREGAGVRQRVRTKQETPFTIWLRHALDVEGLSLSEFARRAGMSSAAVPSRWLSGESKPAVSMCKRIAQAFRVDLDFVLEKAGYRPATLVGETSERGGILASMVKRVNWDDETRYTVMYRMVRGFLEEDRLAESSPNGSDH
jgi:transcriptional regulator with XRE-family HTH domain